jgi:ceramide glucosyltransferase
MTMADGLIHELGAVPIWISLLGSAYLAFAAGCVWRFGRYQTRAPVRRPPVSILKPLSGHEAELYSNLSSFCEQRYPEFQIVFGVRRADDPALQTVRRVMTARPELDLSVVIDDRVSGANPKVANLINMLPAARHDILVLADSDVRVGPDYLNAVVSALTQPGAGAATCLYAGRPNGGFWSELGALFINQGFLPAALLGKLLCSREDTFGATIAIDREKLEEIGGFGAIGDYFVDDCELGRRVRETGATVALVPCLVDTVVDAVSPVALLRQQLRSMRAIRTASPAGIFGLFIAHPFSFAALGALLEPNAPVTLTALITAIATHVVLARTTAVALHARVRVWLLPFYDCLSSFLLVAALFVRRISWRGRLYDVDAQGRLTPIDETRVVREAARQWHP